MASTTIEIDAETADLIERRAAAEGLTTSEFLVALVRGEEAVSTEDIAELDRRWAKIAQGESTVAHEEVVRWLKTWGTAAYKPWSSDH